MKIQNRPKSNKNQFVFNQLNDIKTVHKNITIYIFINTLSNSFENEYLKLESELELYTNIKIEKRDSRDFKNISIIEKFNIKSYPFIIFKYDNKHMPYSHNMNAFDIIKFINTNIMVLKSLVNISNSSGESLILLTESPHSNIIKWASPLYENHGSLKKMIATGFHKAVVWESILFQIMYILYILQKEDIYFEEFSLETNIFIKDLYYEPNTLNYWIYNIDGLDYYVPNYGYLVLFDSKYSDLENNEFKIRSTKLYPHMNHKKEKKNDLVDYSDLIFLKFKDVFTPFIFFSKLKKQGGLEPEESVLELLRKIQNCTSSTNIIFYYFS